MGTVDTQRSLQSTQVLLVSSLFSLQLAAVYKRDVSTFGASDLSLNAGRVMSSQAGGTHKRGDGRSAPENTGSASGNVDLEPHVHVWRE